MTERFGAILSGIARGMRAVLGAPDYDRYVRHVRQVHPRCKPMTRSQFEKERLESRYSKPGARCC
jgi:uncharacterized short protein YbdD (DUF466 family)